MAFSSEDIKWVINLELHARIQEIFENNMNFMLCNLELTEKLMFGLNH